MGQAAAAGTPGGVDQEPRLTSELQEKRRALSEAARMLALWAPSHGGGIDTVYEDFEKSLDDYVRARIEKDTKALRQRIARLEPSR